jgi:hypothetical protein
MAGDGRRDDRRLSVFGTAVVSGIEARTMSETALTIQIPRNDALLWCKRLYWMEKGHRGGGHVESAEVLKQLYDMFFHAAMEQLTPAEVEAFSASDRIDTFPEFIDEK